MTSDVQRSLHFAGGDVWKIEHNSEMWWCRVFVSEIQFQLYMPDVDEFSSWLHGDSKIDGWFGNDDISTEFLRVECEFSKYIKKNISYYTSNWWLFDSINDIAPALNDTRVTWIIQK